MAGSGGADGRDRLAVDRNIDGPGGGLELAARRSPSLPRPLRCSRSRICSRAAAMIRRCRTSTRPSNISLRRQDRLAPSVGPTRILADWLHLHAFPAARYSSKPQRSHCRDTTPRRPLPSRNPHEISWRGSPGDRCGVPTSPSSGHRILVSDLLHQPARKGNSIDSLRETAIIDQLLAPIAEQLRRVRNRILY